MDLTESILETVKKELGIEPDYTHFDPELIVAINGAFVILCQLGIGPDTPYAIEDKYSTWDEFAGPGISDLVKADIALRVKLLFDPPSNTFLVDSINKQISEFEFRMLVQADEETS